MHLGLALVALALVSHPGCKKDQPKTTVAATWKNADAPQGPFVKLFVIGVGKDDVRRRLYEDTMVATLRKQGVEAQASYGDFPDSEKLEKQGVLDVVEEGGFDAVVLTHVLSVDQQLEYVPGKTKYEPTSNADMYMMDYDQKYLVTHDPGYYKTNTTFSVETTLYEAGAGVKVWATLSETVNPDSVEEVIEQVITVTVTKMKTDGLIP